MTYDPSKHNRRSIRLHGYDYSQSGIYFITICTHEKQCIFGTIQNAVMSLNSYGEIVREEWLNSEKLRAEITLDDYVIIPNHFHGLVWIHQKNVTKNIEESSSDNAQFVFQGKSLAGLIGGFKAAVTHRIRRKMDSSDIKIWQRNYHEHIVRNKEGLNYLRYYICHNPKNWGKDSLHNN